MADTLSFSWELKGQVEQQIKAAIGDAEKFKKTLEEIGIDSNKIDFEKNIRKNVQEAEKALYKLMDAKEKVDKALSRNMSMRSDGFLGMDEGKLLKASGNLDEVIHKLINVGVEASLSSNAVKDLLASLSANLVLKDAKSTTSAFDKGLDKQIRERAKAQKEMARELATAFDDADKAAKNNVKNQELVKDALAKIATARANLSAASDGASLRDQAHARLLMSLLDQLAKKLNVLKGEFLGERGMLDGVLGSGYKGLMRNISTAIQNITKMSMGGMGDDEWNREKALAAQLERRQQIIAAVNEQATAQEKAAQQEAAAVNRVNELLEIRRHRLEMEQKKNAELYAEKQRQLAIQGESAAWHTSNQETAATIAREKELLKLREAIIKRSEQEAAAQERATQRQNASNQARQQQTQKIRQQAEELVKLRMELLKTQAAELQSLLKNGKETFSAQQYEQVRNALRGVREEMRQLEGAMQRLSSYSLNDLLGFGRGTQNWSPLITNGQQISNAQQAIRQLSAEEEKLIQSIDKASSAFQNQNRVLGDLQMMTQQYLSLWGAKDFLNNIIQIGGQLEMQRLSIGAILGDTAHANDLFERIKSLAVQSPFGVVELDQYTKQLSAYGFKYNELYDMTKRLADISAGAGTDVGRLALALGHVRSEAALSGYTLRQFAMNNIPMVGELAKMLTEVEGKLVSVAEVRKRVKNKEISYEDVEAVIKKLTDEGGMFYNMQEVISQSVKARWKNLKDSLDIMYGEMAEASVGGTLKDTAVILTNLSRHWKELFAVLQSGLVVLGTYKAIMLVNTLLVGRETAAVELGIKSKLKADAANIKLASSYRTLTAAEQAFTGLRGKSLIMAEALALSEKKLTAEGLARQVALGKLTKAEAMQVIALSRLRGEEMLHAQTLVSNVYTYGRFTGVVNGLTMGVKRLGLALKSLVWNPLTAVFAVVGVATELWQKNNEEVERAKELNDSLFNRATEGIKNIKQMMGETGMTFVFNGKETDFGDLDKLKNGGKFEFTPAAELSSSEMVSAIEKWTQFIKEYSANPNNILNESFADQSGQVRNLAEQYELLGKAVGETAEAYVWLKQASEAMQYGEEFTNGGLFNDDLITNINDYAQDVKDYNDAVTNSVIANRQLWSASLKAARANAGFAGTLKREGIEAENLSEQIKVLMSDQERYAGAIKLAEKAAEDMGSTLSAFKRSADSDILGIGSKFGISFGFDTTLKDYYDSMKLSLLKMNSDIDMWAYGVKEKLKGVGWDFENLSKGQIQALGLSIAEVVAKANKGTENIRKEVQRIMRERMNVPIDADTANAVAAIAGLKQSLADLVGHEWTIDVKTATNFSDVISNIRKSYKSAKEYFENAKPLAIKMGIDVSGGLKKLGQMQITNLISKWKHDNPGKDSTMYEEFLREWNNMAAAMSDAMDFSKETGISLTDPNKNKKSGTKKDKQLEEAKTRLDEVKKFYTEYKKYLAVYKDEKKTQGIVEELFGMKPGEGDAIVKDYKATIRKIIDSLPDNNDEARKKFKIAARQLVGDIDLDEVKKDLDFKLKELQEYITKRTSDWNLYKQLLEKTGDKEFAKNAFVDNRVFDEAARELEKKLMDMTGETVINYTMTQAAAEKYYEKNKDAYELWKKIVELTTHNWTDGLSKGAEAYSQLLTVSEKIKKNEEEIKRLREEGAGIPGNELRIIALQKENDKLGWEQFQQGSDYLRFFGAVLTMANSEVEMTAQTIRNRLATELARGTITAHQYSKSLKEVNDQLAKGRSAMKGELAMFLQGGQQGIVNYRQEEVQNAAFRVEEARKELDLLERRQAEGENVSREEIYAARAKLELAKDDLDAASKALGISSEYLMTLNKMALLLGVMKGVFDGVTKVCKNLADMYDALGNKSLSNDFSDMADFMEGVTAAITPIDNIVQSAMKGNVSGIISNALSAPVQMITGPVTAFAKLHDKQIQREIDASKERQKEMETMTKNLDKAIERTLGGVYSLQAEKADIDNLREYQRKYLAANAENPVGGSYINAAAWGYIGSDTKEAIDKAVGTGSYYDTKLAELMIQRDELKKQLSAEEKKKKSDSDAIKDYQQSIRELDDEIKHFALDMAKSLYDIDLQSWSKDLTDAIVSAWEKGENAVDAYKNKVKDLMKQLTTSILSKKIMEKALEKVGLDDLIANMMASASGQLNEENVGQIADALVEAGEDSTTRITAILDALERRGYIQKDDSGSSSSSSATIKGVTEQKEDLIASYLNAIRADVSVNRMTLTQILYAVQTQTEMPVIAKAQLDEMHTLVTLARDRNAALEEVRNMFHRVTAGGDRVRIA